ncbi:MAG TPA: hypothetical protein VIF86_07730 [Methylobacter sp.]|jgi:hypothetical protein
MNSFIHFEEPNLACDIYQDDQTPYLLSDSLDALLDRQLEQAERAAERAERGLGAIISKVVRKGGKHITKEDYNDTRPLLGSENVKFPRVKSLQARALRRLFSIGRKISHRDFDAESCSYRLAGYIGFLRDKGWVVIDHPDSALTNDSVPRIAPFVRYELFAEFTEELAERVKAFCKAVDEFEAKAAAKQTKQKAA